MIENGRNRLAVVVAPGSAALPADRGAFSDVVRIERSPGGATDFAEGLRQACELAEANGCDWLVAPERDEALRADTFALLAPALGAYDAIFGAVHVAGASESIWRPSRLAFEAADRLPHALLHWWVGRTAVMRTPVIRAVLGGQSSPSGSSGETAALDHLFRLFGNHRCIKFAQPLFDVATEPALLSDNGRAFVLDRLERAPVFLPVHHGAETYRLPYTGRNAGIEREQTRGQFFEAAELRVLADRLGEGRHIVDIGANTGNHTVYFAGPMRAASVLPFEPLPDIAAILSRTVAENGLDTVDLCHLCLGLSDAPGRARVIRSERGGLGASRLEAGSGGEIEVVRLDDVLTRAPDFLKIDVERMEMKVLAGAKTVIETARPLIFIEIANDNTAEFVDWTRRNHYRVERIFSDKGHSNYLIAPSGKN
ncbi:MAG: FkbM family methyltransferase [Rhizobiaceae bacterium]|nr:FkbM family methyltransferase [Rhizobiaceae bacterium]